MSKVMKIAASHLAQRGVVKMINLPRFTQAWMAACMGLLLSACGGTGSAVVSGTGGTSPSGTGGAPGMGSGGSSTSGTGGSVVATGGAGTESASGGFTGSGSGGLPARTGGAGGGPRTGGSGGRMSSGGATGVGGAGLGGAGVAGRSGVGGAARSPCGTAKICDDFESYTSPTNLAPWTTNVSAGSVKIDSTHVYSGRQAVMAHADMGANKAAQMSRSGAPLFPASPNLFWGRMMVYMTGLPPSSVHYDNIQADGQGQQQPQYRIGGMGGILLNYQPHDCYDHISTVLPQDKWACWQWLYDGTKNSIEFYVDGQLQTRVVGTGQGCVDGTTSTWTAPTFNAVHLGWVNYQSMPAGMDMWMDDVALGPDRIDCPAPGSNPAAH